MAGPTASDWASWNAQATAGTPTPTAGMVQTMGAIDRGVYTSGSGSAYGGHGCSHFESAPRALARAIRRRLRRDDF